MGLAGGTMVARQKSRSAVEIPSNWAEHERKRGRAAAPNLQVFTLAGIEAATGELSIENKLREGGYGPVYKGELPNGQDIAVKKLSKTSTQGFEEFKNEVVLTAKLQHVNLVRLLGFCTERNEQMLIYEYMPNKSLDFYLFEIDPSKSFILDWRRRIGIIEGITQGLLGYVPPEYVKKGVYSTKSDVYSFGVLLLQIISGKRNAYYYGLDESLNLLDYAYELWKEGKGMELMDPVLDDTISSLKLIRCMQTALLCVQETAKDRPSMLEVSSMLKNESAVLTIPKKPAFSRKTDEDQEEDHKPILQQEICSDNFATISELVAR
ncbi:cysteine-rich receptor-like protein kinase 4 [Juglans regia]|uniref:non-specific serine/threonine protein kinase n=1 Tax=Juglans regia TaxID=51240 RepID=A0A6P9EFP7_JUGRE|nr:cysteine-rich receptor-like protein kinase 4 [Juglans regia]